MAVRAQWRAYFMHAEGHKPPNLPIAILVNFPDYTGPPFVQNKK